MANPNPAMAVPSPHATLARLLIGLYRLWVQHLIQHLLGVGPVWTLMRIIPRKTVDCRAAVMCSLAKKSFSLTYHLFSAAPPIHWLSPMIRSNSLPCELSSLRKRSA